MLGRSRRPEANMTRGREKRTLFSSIPPQPAYRRQPTKGKPLSAAGRQGWPSVAEGTVCPFTGASEAWRGGDRRPAGGGSSDAARTLVPAKPGQREGVALCRAVGRRQEDDLCNHADRQGGLSQRGVRGCRGQGAAQAPVPCRLAAQATKIKCLDEAAVLQRKKKRTQGRRRPSDAARTLVMCPARGRKSGHAQKDAPTGTKGTEHPAARCKPWHAV